MCHPLLFLRHDSFRSSNIEGLWRNISTSWGLMSGPPQKESGSLGFLSCAPVETTLCSWLTGMECPRPPSARAVTSTVESYFSCGDTAYLPKVLLHCGFGQTPTAHLCPFMAKSPVGSQEHGDLVGTLSPLEHSHHRALGASTCPHALSTQTRQGSGVLGASSEQGHLVLGQHKWLETFLLVRCPLVTATVTLSRLAPPPQATSSATQITLD